MRVIDTTCVCTDGWVCTDNARLCVFSISIYRGINALSVPRFGCTTEGRKGQLYYPLLKDEKTVYGNP